MFQNNNDVFVKLLCIVTFYHMIYIFLGCENDWLEFGGHCYILLEKKSTWAEARVKTYHL